MAEIERFAMYRIHDLLCQQVAAHRTLAQEAVESTEEQHVKENKCERLH